MDLINFCLNIVQKKKEIIAIVYTLGLILSQEYSRFLITSSISNLKKKKNSSNRRRKRIVVSLCEPGQLAQRVLERAYRSLSLCFSGTGCIARIGHQLSIGSIRHDNDFLLDATGGPLKSYIYIYLRNHFRDHPVFVTQPRRYSIETAVISSRLNRDIGLTSISLVPSPRGRTLRGGTRVGKIK